MATQPCNNNFEIDKVDHSGIEVYDENSDGTSIFDKFKKKFGESKRPGFLQIVKMDSGVDESDRNQVIMTPNNGIPLASNQRAPDLDSSKGDLNNSSHYYRFKRHSLGY